MQPVNDEAQKPLQGMRVTMRQCRIRRETQIETHLLRLRGFAFATQKN